ncbi:Cyclin PHO80-like protein [Pleurotus pulmonarius]
MESSTSERVELPASFEDADMDYLAQLIADMLERLMVHNDRIPLLPESLTRFHSRSAPNISVLDYLRRIIRFTNVEKSCLLLTLHYVDQICARTPLFTLSSLTCHRFVIAAIAVSSKGLCDTFCTNSLYAKVGGISLSELNLLEREFLSAIDWRLTCTREVLQEYYINLVRTHSSGTFVIIGPQSPTMTSSSSDIDIDSTQSRSVSPSDTPTRSIRHRHRPSPHETSAILIDTSMLAPEAPVRATLEQNMAFAALQQSRDASSSEDDRDQGRDQASQHQ